MANLAYKQTVRTSLLQAGTTLRKWRNTRARKVRAGHGVREGGQLLIDYEVYTSSGTQLTYKATGLPDMR